MSIYKQRTPTPPKYKEISATGTTQIVVSGIVPEILNLNITNPSDALGATWELTEADGTHILYGTADYAGGFNFGGKTEGLWMKTGSDNPFNGLKLVVTGATGTWYISIVWRERGEWT